MFFLSSSFYLRSTSSRVRRAVKTIWGLRLVVSLALERTYSGIVADLAEGLSVHYSTSARVLASSTSLIFLSGKLPTSKRTSKIFNFPRRLFHGHRGRGGELGTPHFATGKFVMDERTRRASSFVSLKRKGEATRRFKGKHDLPLVARKKQSQLRQDDED